MHSIERVREFHRVFGHPDEPAPTLSTLKFRQLRVNLIATELCEFADCLGVSLHINSPWKAKAARSSEEVRVTVVAHDLPEEDLDIIGAADAYGDLDYVVQGGALTFGFPAEAIGAEVHRSNMSKAGADGKPIYRADGKVLKGPNWFKPNIAAVLAAWPPHAVYNQAVAAIPMKPDRETELYFEAHITIEPVFDSHLQTVETIAVAHGFRVADLLMQKRQADTAVRSRNDTFMTGHGKDFNQLKERMAQLIKDLKAGGYKVWRYKIEDTIMDSRANDVLAIL